MLSDWHKGATVTVQKLSQETEQMVPPEAMIAGALVKGGRERGAADLWAE